MEQWRDNQVGLEEAEEGLEFLKLFHRPESVRLMRVERLIHRAVLEAHVRNALKQSKKPYQLGEIFNNLPTESDCIDFFEGEESAADSRFRLCPIMNFVAACA